jgi:Acetyl-coenzyme A synthetase N-terminus
MDEEHHNGGEDLGSRTYPPPEEFAKNANVQDPEVWKKAAEDYESFWEGWAKELHWFKEWDQALDWNPPLRVSEKRHLLGNPHSPGPFLSSLALYSACPKS